jgi:hypothetical protein
MGAKTYFLTKKQQKDTIFRQKSKNILFLACQGGARAPLPSPADAHALNYNIFTQKTAFIKSIKNILGQQNKLVILICPR